MEITKTEESYNTEGFSLAMCHLNMDQSLFIIPYNTTHDAQCVILIPVRLATVLVTEGSSLLKEVEYIFLSFRAENNELRGIKDLN